MKTCIRYVRRYVIRGIYFEWRLLQETPPITCDEKLAILMQAISAKGISR